MGQQSYQGLPTYDQPITTKGQTTPVWYRFFNALWGGQPLGNEQTIAVGASPFSYLALSKGSMLVKGGTVSAITITRSATTLTGLTAGFIPLANGDTITVTYAALPAMVWYP